MDKINVIEQKTALLYGDEIIAVRADDGHVYVSLRQMCNALEIKRNGQVRRIKNHAVLSQGYKGGHVLLPPSSDGRGGGKQTAGLLRIDLVPLWLTGIRTASIKENLRKKLTLMQANAARILWEAFQSGELTVDSSFEELLAQDTDAVQAYKMAMAVVKLAKQQILLDGRMGDTELRLDEVESRLTTVEEQLSGADVVTEAQASQISQSVKAVALALGKQSGRNEFGACYGELYRKFGITSYKLMPRSKFNNAMKFLTEWHQTLVGNIPF